MNRFAPCAHLGYLFTEVPLRERFAAAARAGFTVIEHPAPYALPAEEFYSLCRDNGLSVAQIALPAGGPEEKGLAAIVGREEEFRRGLAEGLAYARTIGCRLIHPMAGVVAPDTALKVSWQTYVSNVAKACDAAAAYGLDVIIEPIGAGTLTGYFMNHPDRALDAIERIARDNLYLSFDAFHAARDGVDPADFTLRAGDRYRHVQVADDPGRREPGTGSIDFDAFFEALDKVGYAGVIGLEYRPSTTTAAGLGWIDRYPRVAPLSPRPANIKAMA